MVSTIYKNIFDKQPHYVSVDVALDRIRVGKSAQKVIEIRETIDKERANNLKCNLPSVCFSGKFSERTDAGLIEHSGFICLDFDNLDVLKFKDELKADPIVYAVWVSPSGKGLKALVKISDPDKHREHFQALQEHFPEIDKSGINVSRVCYESWDSEIHINKNSEVFKKVKKTEKVKEQKVLNDSVDVFQKLLVWLSNTGGAFRTGERNQYIFRLASACNRFGMDEHDCQLLTRQNLSASDSSFPAEEMQRTIKGAYQRGRADFGTAEFTNDVLVDRVTRSEIEVEQINHDLYDLSVKPKDVIYGEDVKGDALSLYDFGYESVKGIGVPEIDELFKMKRGEVSGLSGIGNYGKSSLLKWYVVFRCIKFGEKFAFFSPEDNPAQEFYHDLVEIYLGNDCSPSNQYRPEREKYEQAYDAITKNIFYIYPKDIAPTPEYIKERFLELCIKEKIDGCIIDPFNQMANDYGKHGRTDKYLETFLSDCSRFAQTNNVYFVIVAHPKQMKKEKGDLNYPEPDVFDLADGAMWNNKLDNILIYHRPLRGTEPNNPIATLSAKKIRRQKIVGRLGTAQFELHRPTRRFFFNNSDPLGKLLGEINILDGHIPNTEIRDMKRNTKFDEVDFDNPIPKEEIPF